MTTELLNTLYVQTQGTQLRLEQDSLRVRIPDVSGRKILPLKRIESIVVYGHVDLSTELITRCAQDNRPVTWMTQGGRYLARLDSAVHGNVLLRHAQHQLHDDPVARLGIARNIVAGEIRNSRWILLRAARDATAAPRDRMRAVIVELEGALAATATAESLDIVMGIEGNAARAYFTALRDALRPPQPPPAHGPRQRPALLHVRPPPRTRPWSGRTSRPRPVHRLPPRPAPR